MNFEVAVRDCVVFALVQCEKLAAIVLEVVGMPRRGLFLDVQKELEVSSARWSKCIMTMFLPVMYVVLPSRSSVILFHPQNSLLQIAVGTTLDVTSFSFLTVKSNNVFAGSSHLPTVSMMYPL